MNAAASDKDEDIRVVAVRAARQLDIDLIPIIEKLVRDPSRQVRRECAVALRGSGSPEAPSLWAELAMQHDGKDRWYLEALGIGASGQWDTYLAAWLKQAGSGWNSPAGRDIIWRSHAQSTPNYLTRILRSPDLVLTHEALSVDGSVVDHQGLRGPPLHSIQVVEHLLNIGVDVALQRRRVAKHRTVLLVVFCEEITITICCN